MYKIVVIGAVYSTKATLKKLVEHGLEVSLVLGLKPKNPAAISGLTDMEDFCIKHDIPFQGFQKINHKKYVDRIRSAKPDVIFAVGFSQLIHDEILSIPAKGTIGFHPTLLPRGRGRAPVAWLILRNESGAATFFLMSQGVDDGPVFVQKPFEVGEDDYASDIEKKIIVAIERALDEWLPKLRKGEWKCIPQNHTQATYYGRRTPQDGWIDWNRSAEDIHRLIRASAKPHPGAYTYFKKNKLTIERASIDRSQKYFGVIGRILRKKGESLLVQCGQGAIWLDDYTFKNGDDEIVDNVKILVGRQLGYRKEDEIFKLLTQFNDV